jgi:hypothetical protein
MIFRAEEYGIFRMGINQMPDSGIRFYADAIRECREENRKFD